MNLKTILKLSIKEIWSSKLRSFLTMLGVIIGVFSIVVLISIGEGASKDITDSFGKDANKIMVNLYNNDKLKTIEYEDVYNMFTDLNVDILSPTNQANDTMTFKKKSENISIFGVDKSFIKSKKLKISEGRFISDMDVKGATNGAVLNQKAKEEFFKNINPIGKSVNLGGKEYTVVGVTSNQEESMFSRVQSEIYLPITTVERSYDNAYINKITITTKEKEEVLGISEKVEAKFKAYYEDRREYLKTKGKNKEEEEEDEYSRYGGGYNENYYIFTPEKELKEFNKMAGMFKLMLGGIASISLVVGGIGIMNIMFVSVSERTREIGIRKAIGAQRKDILIQFLIEAGVVSGMGGIIGIALALGVNALIAKFSQLNPVATAPTIALAFGFSFAIGIIFGIYPANKAAKLKPIDALRFD